MTFPYDLTGTRLDQRYHILGLLGKGGMGHVYEATHVALDQQVAIKVLHPRYAHEERFRERFIREARSASKIKHRNVVQITDFGKTPNDSVYFVMEYLDGHDLSDELRKSGAMEWSRTRHILLQAVRALRAAHSKNIIHRDVKPGNCFLTTDHQDGIADFVKVLDFGIAKVVRDSQANSQGKELTGTGEVFGTAAYMSPEQSRGEELDARSDMYSLGIMAFQMLTGKVPFTGVNAIHVITQHMSTAPPAPRSIVSSIPADVERLVLKMLAKECTDRYDSMAALETAIRAIPESVGRPGRRSTRVWQGAPLSQPRAVASGTLDARTNTGRDVMAPSSVAEERAAAPKAAFSRPSAPALLPRASEPPPASAKPRFPEHVDPGSGSNPSLGPDPAYGSDPSVAPPGSMPVTGRDPPQDPRGHGVASAPIWTSNSASTGPLQAHADCARETTPQSLADDESPVVTGRMIAIVMVLVMAVGGGAAVATMFVLQRGGVPEEKEVESPDFGAYEQVPHVQVHEADDGAALVEGADGVPKREEPAAAEESLSYEEEQDSATSSGGVTDGEGGEESSTGSTSGEVEAAWSSTTGDEEVVIEDEPESEDDLAPSVTENPKVLRRPKYESDSCLQMQTDLESSFKDMSWSDVVRLARQRSCWPSSGQKRRLQMYVRALMEMKRFAECVKVGRRSKDVKVQEMVSICTKQLG